MSSAGNFSCHSRGSRGARRDCEFWGTTASLARTCRCPLRCAYGLRAEWAGIRLVLWKEEGLITIERR